MVYGPVHHELAPPITEDDVENPAAWHPDPSGKHDHRWWDGQRWTEHVADGGVASIDPLPAAPEASAATVETGGSGAPGTSEEQDAGAGATSGSGAEEPGVELPSRDDDGRTRELDAQADQPGPGDPAGSAGTAGSAPAEGRPVWGQDPQQSQQPHGQQPHGQQPWAGAPAAGTPWGQQPAWGPGPAQPQQAGGMAIAALVTGILSLPLLIAAGLGGVVGIVAVVLGVIAVRRANRGEAGGKGLAIGGIVTGAISIVLGIILAIFFFSVGIGVFQEMEACMQETGGDQAECERRLERELTERFLGE